MLILETILLMVIFFYLGDNECFIYELLHALLYAMNLKAASIPKDKAREVIKKIFL